jgi:phosphoglycolate phosphatase
MTGTAPLLALDLDGTLVTCAPRQCAVLRASLCVTGGTFTVDTEAVFRRKREGANSIAALEAEGVPRRHAELASQRFQNTVEDFTWLALDRPFPDVVPSLRALRGASLRLVCLTARQRPRFAQVELQNLGLLDSLDDLIVVSPFAAAREKARALRALGAFAMVGDTESDARAAADAGIPFAAVGTGQRSERFLREAGCAPVFPSFEVASHWVLERVGRE